jgi:hypothetical protein
MVSNQQENGNEMINMRHTPDNDFCTNLKIFILLIFISPFTVLSFFNQPSGDDYWSANTVNSYGRIGAVWHLYSTISGRYFSNFIMSICNTLPEGKVVFFKFLPIFIIIVLVITFSFFYNSLFLKPLNQKHLAIASLVSVAIHIINMRSLHEGLYWASSVIVYQLAIIIFLVGIAAIIKYIRKPSRVTASLAIFCCIALPGTSELIAPVYLLVIIFLGAIFKSRNQTTFFISCILTTFSGIGIVLMSPGNYLRIRNDALHFSQNAVDAIVLSIKSAGYYTIVGSLNPSNILLLLLLLPFLLKISASVAKLLHPLRPLNKAVLFITVSFLVCASIYFPLFYFEADVPFPRVTMMVFLIGFFLFFVCLSLILDKIPLLKRQYSKIIFLKNYEHLCWLLFFVTLFFSKNFINASNDILKGTAYNYNIEYINRFNEIRNCKTDTCYINSFQHLPISLEEGLPENRNSEAFSYRERYFGKTILFEY